MATTPFRLTPKAEDSLPPGILIRLWCDVHRLEFASLAADIGYHPALLHRFDKARVPAASMLEKRTGLHFPPHAWLRTAPEPPVSLDGYVEVDRSKPLDPADLAVAIHLWYHLNRAKAPYLADITGIKYQVLRKSLARTGRYHLSPENLGKVIQAIGLQNVQLQLELF